MNILAYGGGTNSTAMLIECVKRDIPVDLILFANTGGELPETYEFVKLFSDWLVKHDYPEIIWVEKGGRKETLEENCLREKMLPSVAYGHKGCSHKYKIQPQDKFCNNWGPAKEEWKAGRKVIKFIGYDADEPQRASIPEDKKYIYNYPLIDWDMGRDECVDAIRGEDLPLPGKSACFFCPNSSKGEILRLQVVYPDLAKRCIAMEKNALENLVVIKGLGRTWSWRDLLATPDMFPDDYCTREMPCGCYDG